MHPHILNCETNFTDVVYRYMIYIYIYTHLPIGWEDEVGEEFLFPLETNHNVRAQMGNQMIHLAYFFSVFE